MIRSPARITMTAAGLAVMMHLLLFAAIRPTTSVRLGGMPVPPKTTYLSPPVSPLPLSGNEVRMVRSPVLFSLPSRMGFSRALVQKDVRTRLTFSQEVESEQFLVVEDTPQRSGGLPDLQALMTTTAASSTPGLPDEMLPTLEARPPARRIGFSAVLKDRLTGGIVLPPALNQASPSPWEVRASVNVSEQGMVNHVFLDQPLESAALNQQVLQLLYGLRFKPGASVDGSIEIYSPEASAAGEESP